jgi:hypothetical protein
MRRGDLLKLTGLSVTVLSAMARRGLLPFDRDEVRADRGWADYSARQVVSLAWALRLTQAGLRQESAAAAVRTGQEALFEADHSPDSSEDLFLGVVGIGTLDIDPETGETALYTLIETLAGTLDCVTQSVRTLLASGSGRPQHLVFINASETVRRVLERADESRVREELLAALPPALRGEPC